MCGGGAGVRGKKAREANLEARRAPMFSQLGVWRAENGWSGHPWCWPEGSSPPATLLYVPVSLVPTAQKHTWVSTSPELVKSGSSSLGDSLVAQSLDRYPKEEVSASSSLPSGCSALHQDGYLDGVAEKRLRVRHR